MRHQISNLALQIVYIFAHVVNALHNLIGCTRKLVLHIGQQRVDLKTKVSINSLVFVEREKDLNCL